ncbi:MAG: nickel-dependent hydrogenase large subunit [Dehalococcoidia bacterium]
MCFKNLPIEFDLHGRPRLLDQGQTDPFATTARSVEELARTVHQRDFDIDPVTRVAGALSFHTVIDLENRRVADAHTESPLFRGYEVILKGRDPVDAIHISSRACGVCGGVHSTTSAMALEMAFNVVPPPLAIIARNLGEAAELVYDHTLHLFLLAGPDYSEAIVSRTSPSLWKRAQQTRAPGAAVHGLPTIAAIMEGLNPLSGRLYLEALDITRAAREIATLMLGKYPHPSAIFPGGIGIEASTDVFNQVLGRIVRLLDYAKKVARLWDDLVDFFYAELPAYRLVGARRSNLLCTGMWDDPEWYDASYAHCADWAERRLVTPGALVDGQLRTTRLDLINLGIEEFVDHAYYQHWEGNRFPTDPLGQPLSPFHPWNKETLPDPTKRNWKEKYTWGTAPRWDREPMETGPLARHWITAIADKLNNEFIYPLNGGLAIDLPKGETAATTLQWKIPERPNALERNRARAYHVAYCGMVAYTFLLKAFEYLRRGETAMSAPYAVPDEAIGVGFWEAGRGTLSHHLVIGGGRIANYQIITPSTWMASPRDPLGVPGPYEEAVINTPLLEEFDRAEDFTGIDILRTIRSFDPCMPCTAHLYAGDRVLHRNATTCACGVDD